MRISFKSASAVAGEFCEWVQVGIAHCKYQAKLHLSPWFSAACAAIASITHFVCTNRENPLNLK